MPTVTGTFVEPDGTPIPNVKVQFRLVDTDGTPVPRAWLASTDETIILETNFVTGPSGTYSVDLPGNADITPSDTRWLRSAMVNKVAPVKDLLLVPTSGGPYPEDDIVVDAIPVVDPLGTARGVLARWVLGGAYNVPISTTSTSWVTLAGLGGTITATDRPISIHLSVEWAFTDAISKYGVFGIAIDGTVVSSRTVTTAVTGQRLDVDLWVPQTLAAGDHTIGTVWAAGAAGTTVSFYPVGLNFGIIIPAMTYCEVIEW